MPPRPEPVTEAFVTTGKRIADLQKEIGAEVSNHAMALRSHLWAAMEMAEATQDFPMHPGEKEEYRKMAETIRSALDRLNALDGRK